MAAGLLALGLAAPASAHDGEDHGLAAAPAGTQAAAVPFPFDVRPAFDLVDHTGVPRRAADFAGRPMLVFFGYAQCESMCDVVLPRLVAALEALGPEADRIAPLFITVDAENDTPAAMADAVARHGGDFIGLTGGSEALAAARASFRVEASRVGDAPDGGPIYAHGSMIYMVGADGMLATLIPPVLGPEAMATTVRRYLGE